MKAGLEPQTGIVIHAISRTGSFREDVPATTRVFIDGRCVGALKDKHGETFPVSAGPHQVTVKHSVLRSETLDVSVPSGERAELECGCHYFWSTLLSAASVLIIGMIFVPQALAKVRLTFWPIVALGLYIVAMELSLWKAFTTAGHILYLRPRTVPPKLSAEDVPPASPTA